MKHVLINPNIVTQNGDYFGTGIPYLPITLANLATQLLNQGDEVIVIDAFGENPNKKRIEGNHIIQGLTIPEIIHKIPEDTDTVYIYASQVVQHSLVLQIIKSIKSSKIKIVPNTQSVVSYVLREEDFGHPILDFKYEEVIPAWDLFPLENYWKLGYAHAPYKEKYLSILSSFGCSGYCKFCIIPAVNKGEWQGRESQEVFYEMMYFYFKYGVTEFHFEDLNPTFDKKRIEDICFHILHYNHYNYFQDKLSFSLKFVSGIKIETIDELTIELMKLAGCDYISFSPESGSKNVLKLMQKPFNHYHAIKMLRLMNKLGITTQACFILGFPGETKQDLKLTTKYLYTLFKEGLDEMAVLVMTAMPGSEIHKELGYTYDDITKYTFSPTWQDNYKVLNRLRFKLYINSMIIKFLYHPFKIFKINKTKMWMTIKRVWRF